MSNKISFQDFLKLVDNTYSDHSFTWRYGQTVMNVLHGVWPQKYNDTVNTEYDCYYDDSKAKIILNKLEQEWMKN